MSEEEEEGRLAMSAWPCAGARVAFHMVVLQLGCTHIVCVGDLLACCFVGSVQPELAAWLTSALAVRLPSLAARRAVWAAPGTGWQLYQGIVASCAGAGCVHYCFIGVTTPLTRLLLDGGQSRHRQVLTSDVTVYISWTLLHGDCCESVVCLLRHGERSQWYRRFQVASRYFLVGLYPP
jgi:hypothetical protein